MITVKQLIKYLRTIDQNLPCAYRIHSEYDSLELTDITIEKLQAPRPDGWIHDNFGNKELAKIDYLVFPGN